MPSSAAPGLSAQLRQAVQRALLQEGRAASEAVLVTLDQDIRGGLLRASGAVQVRAITTGLRSTTEDSLAVLSAGVRAVASKESEGLLAALSAALPAQRGWTVRVIPVLRGTGSDAEPGLAVELAQLGHPPDAVATFWSSSGKGQSTEPDQAPQPTAAATSLDRLVDPVALWIATRLVSRQLARSGAPKRWWLRSRGKLSQELAGLQRQLAGQLALYATRKQQEFDRGFAEQALADLADSVRLLPEYYRPHATSAAVHERLGWSYRRGGDMQHAADEFQEGVRSWDQAVQRLAQAADASPQAHVAALERAQVRRAKCRLLSGDRGQLVIARQELAKLGHLTAVTSLDLYNGACLFAVAIGCPHVPSEEEPEFGAQAWYLLGRALLAGGEEGPWALAMTDVELEAMDRSLRSRFLDELGARHPAQTPLVGESAMSIVTESMRAIGIAPPEEAHVTRS
jgi:hypothetical protein